MRAQGVKRPPAPRELFILGASGTALEVRELLRVLDPRSQRYRCVGYLDDDPSKAGTMWGDAPVVGPLTEARHHPAAVFVDAIGSARSHRARERIVSRACTESDRFVTLVHPRAWVSPTARIGAGAIVLAGAVLGAGAQIGEHVTVLSNAVLNHGVTVGAWTLVGSGVTLSGDVSIGRSCFLGAGSHVVERRAIGHGALVGMGSVVLRDVAAGLVVAGNPARVLRRQDDSEHRS